jgi:hypothetical protein
MVFRAKNKSTAPTPLCTQNDGRHVHNMSNSRSFSSGEKFVAKFNVPDWVGLLKMIRGVGGAVNSVQVLDSLAHSAVSLGLQSPKRGAILAGATAGLPSRVYKSRCFDSDAGCVSRYHDVHRLAIPPLFQGCHAHALHGGNLRAFL